MEFGQLHFFTAPFCEECHKFGIWGLFEGSKFMGIGAIIHLKLSLVNLLSLVYVMHINDNLKRQAEAVFIKYYDA